MGQEAPILGHTTSCQKLTTYDSWVQARLALWAIDASKWSVAMASSLRNTKILHSTSRFTRLGPKVACSSGQAIELVTPQSSAAKVSPSKHSRPL